MEQKPPQPRSCEKCGTTSKPLFPAFMFEDEELEFENGERCADCIEFLRICLSLKKNQVRQFELLKSTPRITDDLIELLDVIDELISHNLYDENTLSIDKETAIDSMCELSKTIEKLKLKYGTPQLIELWELNEENIMILLKL